MKFKNKFFNFINGFLPTVSTYLLTVFFVLRFYLKDYYEVVQVYIIINQSAYHQQKGFKTFLLRIMFYVHIETLLNF